MSDLHKTSLIECEFKVWVSESRVDVLSFDKAEGQSHQLVLSGNIDDPFQGPLGDISEHEAGSEFSFVPIEVQVNEATPRFSSLIRETHGDDAIGSLKTQEMLKIEQWEMLGKTYSSPAVNAQVGLPWEAIQTLQTQLSRCRLENRLLFLTLRVHVSEEQLTAETKEFEKKYGCKLSNIDITKKQRFAIYAAETAVSREKYQSELEDRLKPGILETEGTRVSAIIKETRIKYDFTYGYFEILQLEGSLPWRGSGKPQVSVSIELNNIDTNFEQPQDYGSYSFLPEGEGYGAHLSLWLNYYSDDFAKLLLPAIISGSASSTVLEVYLKDKLDFTNKQSGGVYSFNLDLRTEYGEDEKVNYTENFDLIETRLKELPTIIVDHQEGSKDKLLESIGYQFGVMFDRIKQLEENSNLPNNIISRIVFKIPFVGRIVKFLIK